MIKLPISMKDVPFMINMHTAISSISEGFISLELPSGDEVNIHVYEKTIDTTITASHDCVKLTLGEITKEKNQKLYDEIVTAIEKVIADNFSLEKLSEPKSSIDLRENVKEIKTMNEFMDTPEVDDFIEKLIKLTEKVISKTAKHQHKFNKILNKIFNKNK